MLTRFVAFLPYPIDGIFSPLAGGTGLQERSGPVGHDYPQEDGNCQYSQSMDYSRRNVHRGPGTTPDGCCLQVGHLLGQQFQSWQCSETLYIH